jgi:GDPmannose 4,6-dehydratase
LQPCLFLGNMSALRDWGHARDYVEMQWLMLQQAKPEDFVIATGEQHSVREFVSLAAAAIDMPLSWSGNGLDETAQTADGRTVVKVDPRYFRPAEVETLLGDASKARDQLGWTPQVKFAELVHEMASADLALAQRDDLVRKHGFNTFESRD